MNTVQRYTIIFKNGRKKTKKSRLQGNNLGERHVEPLREICYYWERATLRQGEKYVETGVKVR
mgnify:CR=1 FL=1